MLDDAASLLPTLLRLVCFQRNQSARRFHERHGFVAMQLADGHDNEETFPNVLYERRAC